MSVRRPGSKNNWKKDHDPEARPLGCNGKYGGSGEQRHYRAGGTPCEACVESRRHYERERWRGQPSPRYLQPCGTVAAARRHRAKGEDRCLPCKLAEAADTAKRRDARPAQRHAIIAG